MCLHGVYRSISARARERSRGKLPARSDGAVMDFKSIADSIHDGRQHSIPICRIPYHYVRRHHVAATADGPDVQVMNVRDPIYAADGGLDCRNVEPPRHTLHENPQAFAKQLPRPRQYPKSDCHSDNRVDQVQPVKRMMSAAMITPSEPSMSLQTSR